MIPRIQASLGRRALLIALCALAACAALAPHAGAVARRGSLSPLLAKLAQPAVASLPPAGQDHALGVSSSGPGSLLRRGPGVLVNVRFEGGAIARLPELRGSGAVIVDAAGAYQTVTAAVAPQDLRRVAGVAGVEGVMPVRAPVVRASKCDRGAKESEGIEQLDVESAPASLLDGTGVEVGVLSDSYNVATEAADGSGKVATHAPEDVASGDLPGEGNTCPGEETKVDVRHELSGPEAAEGEDEGRAMLQIVHDIAPKATLSFATAFEGEFSFASNIKELAKKGANVIVDDVAYLNEPFFQDGPVAVAADKVASEGVTYVSAAGNDNLIERPSGRDIASWETKEFRDSEGCPPAIEALPEFNGGHCLDFDPGAGVDRTFGMKVPGHTTVSVDLQWNEPWGGVSTDLDAILLDAEGRLLSSLREGTEDNVNQSQEPFEFLEWTNNSSGERTVQLAINRFVGGTPRVKFVLAGNGEGPSAVEYPHSSGNDVVGPSIYGHAASSGVIGAAAVFPGEAPQEPEEYSSRGPVTHYFGPVEGKSAAAELGSPETIPAPEVTATDCVTTTFFAQFVGGRWRFCGTSAAAPHVAGVAALLKQAEPLAEPEEIRSALRESAQPIGEFRPCAIGAGLVDAAGAVEKLLLGPSAGPVECEPPQQEVEPDEARAPGNWGSESPAPPRPPAEGGQPQATPGPAPVNPPPFVLRATFAKHPGRLVRTRASRARVVFRFTANERGVTFLCRVDREKFHACSSKLVRRVAPGSHAVRLMAKDSAGNVDATPDVYRFRVVRRR